MKRIATSLPFKELPVAAGNYGPESARLPIDMIVIHTMVGTPQAAAARFNKAGEQASAHYGVGYDGTLYHWLEEYLVAYHAGNYGVNQRSIGIEHQDNGLVNGVYDDGPRPDALYEASARLVKDICDFYHIPLDRQHIVKHNEVSQKPTACPDALDIDRIIRLAGGQTPETTVAVPQKDFENLVTKSTKYDEFVTAGYISVADVAAKLQGVSDRLQEAVAANTAKDKEISTLKAQVALQVPTITYTGHDREIRPLVWDSWLTYLRSRGIIRSLVGRE